MTIKFFIVNYKYHLRQDLKYDIKTVIRSIIYKS